VKTTTLVLLPGLDGTDILFRPFVTALPAWVTALCVQYPASETGGYAALMPLVRNACRGQNDYFLLGWSFSGPLALMFAAESPSGLRGVVLCASFVCSPWPVLCWLRFAVVSPVARLFPLFSRALTLGYGSEELDRDKAESWSRVAPATLAARSRAALAVDVRRELRRCPAPLLYLGASRDIVVPRWNARLIQKEMPSARVVIIDGPHLALRSNPVDAAAAVTTFMMDAHR